MEKENPKGQKWIALSKHGPTEVITTLSTLVLVLEAGGFLQCITIHHPLFGFHVHQGMFWI